MKPTKEQEEEFWKCFGWRYAPGLGLISPDGEDIVPPIDLNNLFKYAVPNLGFDVKFIEWTDGQFEVELLDGDHTRVAVSKDLDPALALFWAIYEIIKGVK